MELPKVFIYLAIFLLKQSVASDLSSLKSLFVVFRHGARAPFFTFDASSQTELWPNGLGELTQRGELQTFRIGQFLRSNYSTFLSGTTNEVDARSSDSSRIIESVRWAWNGFVSGDKVCQQNQTLPIRVDETFPFFTDCPSSLVNLGEALKKQNGNYSRRIKVCIGDFEFYSKLFLLNFCISFRISLINCQLKLKISELGHCSIFMQFSTT